MFLFVMRMEFTGIYLIFGHILYLIRTVENMDSRVFRGECTIPPSWVEDLAPFRGFLVPSMIYKHMSHLPGIEWANLPQRGSVSLGLEMPNVNGTLPTLPTLAPWWSGSKMVETKSLPS